MSSADEIQKFCEGQGKLPYIKESITGGYGVYAAGLCPRCGQPIVFNLTNGGKLSPSRTLRLEHVFSGSIRCEEDTTNEQIRGMTGQQKVDFFCRKHDEETVKELPEPLRSELLESLLNNK